jgi:hypothetical protein
MREKVSTLSAPLVFLLLLLLLLLLVLVLESRSSRSRSRNNCIAWRIDGQEKRIASGNLRGEEVMGMASERKRELRRRQQRRHERKKLRAREAGAQAPRRPA